MKKLLSILILTVMAFVGSRAYGQAFFDTADAPKFFSLSARIGFNTSNRTFPKGYYNLWNKNSWGLGFNVGALANLNFKEYLSVQPGIFFETRSGDYAYLTDYLGYYGSNETHYEMGHLRAYYLTIPVVAQAKFNLCDFIKWSVDFGPYLQFCLKETGQNNVAVLYRLPQSNRYDEYTAQQRSVDFGFKMGTGLQFFRHYYVGVHYLAGALNAWKLPAGGKNKSWTFTLGYDF